MFDDLYEPRQSPLEMAAGNLSDAEDVLAKVKNKHPVNQDEVDAAQAKVDRFKARLLKLDPHGVGAVYAKSETIVALARQLS